MILKLFNFRSVFFIFYLLSFILKSPAATAQVSPSLSVSPAKFDLVAVPGQIQQVGIKVTNRSEVALPLKAVVMDFAPRDDKGGVAVGESLPNRSALNWFRVPQPDLILKTGEAKTVKVNISPPETVANGSYFALVMFQSQLPSTYFGQNDQAKIVPWIGTLFLLRVGNLPKLDDSSLTVNSFTLPRVQFGREVPASLVVTNNTNFHLSPQTEFQLKTVGGSTVVAKVSNQDSTIMPGRSRKIEATLVSADSIGLYQGTAELILADYHKTVTSQRVYFLSPIGLVVTSFLVLGVLGWIFRRKLGKSRKLKAES
jgi:hypothetical protein